MSGRTTVLEGCQVGKLIGVLGLRLGGRAGGVTASIAAQLLPKLDMSKDYDQLLNRLESGPDSPAARAAVGIEGGGARADDQRGRVEGGRGAVGSCVEGVGDGS